MNVSKEQKVFLNMCKTYVKNLRRRKQYLEQLEKVRYQARGVHGVRYDALPVHTGEFDWTIWDKKQQCMQAKLERCEEEIRLFEGLFQCQNGWLVWSIYINHLSVQEMAHSLGMNPNSLSRKVQKQIRKMIRQEI